MRRNEMMVTSFDSFVPPTACVAAGWIPALLFKRPRVRRDTFQTECVVDFFFFSLLVFSRTASVVFDSPCVGRARDNLCLSA